MNRLMHNEVIDLLTQGVNHASLFAHEINGHQPNVPFAREQRTYFESSHLPECGFRNYWYPVMLSSDLKSRPLKRRLLGEDIVFWRDRGKMGALADRCPHRGASLANGHLRFPGSGTLSCPYHGWTFDGSGNLLACIQEGPDSVMPGRVRAKAYPVEERLGVIWTWIGDLDPVPVDEDLPVAMRVPGVVNHVHFTNVWNSNWAFLFDNFLDRLHPPYVHRTSPQFFFNPMWYRSIGTDAGMELTEHERKILEYDLGARPGQTRTDQVEFPDLGKFPRSKWWRRGRSKRRATETFIPGFKPGMFINGLPSYIETPHADLYFTQFIIPIDREHLYNMCALTGRQTTLQKLRWKLQYRLFSITHDTYFIGQDQRIVRYLKPGPEHLSPWDQDVIRWRRFAVQNARGARPQDDNDSIDEERQARTSSNGDVAIPSYRVLNH